MRVTSKDNNILDSVGHTCYPKKSLRGSKGDYPYDEGKHLLAMVWFAYADDSETHEASEYCLLAGYIGSPSQWKGFRRDWRRILGDIREFKSTEFFQVARWQSSESPYRGWDSSTARVFLNNLLRTIDQYDLRPFGGATKTADFYRYPKEVRTWLTGANFLTMTDLYEGQLEVNEKLIEHEGSPERPYFVVFPGLLVDAMRATSGERKPKIHIYLDRQGDAEAKGKEVFDLSKERLPMPETDNLASLTYADSHDEVGLQAADLYAYTWNRKLTGRMNSDLERAFCVLTKKKPKIAIADRAYFDALLAKGTKDRQSAIRIRMAELS